MALWMEAGSEPKTESEVVDLEAISALKQSTAIELKENGNEYVKKGKKHYSDAIDCYTRAISQKALSDAEQSILYCNRAHVNLLLGNYRRALQDAEEAIKLSPTNVKAFYRAVKASMSLSLLAEAKSYCEKGLELSPENEELNKLAGQIDLLKSEQDRRKAEVSKSVTAVKDMISAFEERKIKIGKALYQELTGVKKPTLDKNNILHWPVLLLYAEVMSSDFIEDICETDMFSTHLDEMFSESSPPLPWDNEHAYTRDALELYYEADSGVRLSKREIFHCLADGTAAANLEKFDIEENDAAEESSSTTVLGGGGMRWIKVNERRRLYDVLKEPNLVVPGIPVFYVVSKKSSFYKEFKSGNWAPPPSSFW
ncbi:tetratricopeptide repeat protein 4 homolog [Coffea eugenioides]|uniref:tetratricopeptide repeat protein 4 homolog n=1 Tax=Coffea eugenioides TaxID=49369 RepID=UPI000F60C4B5|nr:tetratricopeptide repeat protein 4 homolog [Coffea eugenioides]